MLDSLSRLLYIAILLGVTTRFRLADVLAELGISQSEAARRSGVSFVTINAMVNNKTRSVALDTLDKLAQSLGLEPGDLLERTTQRP